MIFNLNNVTINLRISLLADVIKLNFSEILKSQPVFSVDKNFSQCKNPLMLTIKSLSYQIYRLSQLS